MRARRGGPLHHPFFARLSAAVTIWFLVCITACTAVSAAATLQDSPVKADASALADQLDAPGVTVIEIGPGGRTTRFDHGTNGAGTPLDNRSVFVWGSVSKSFTALLATRLAERGLIDLNAPVTRYLPELRGSALADVTGTDLIHHTSGLSHDLALTDQWGRRGTARDAVPTLLSAVEGPRGTFRYSSLNYLLLQAVLESATGQEYGPLLDSEVGTLTGAGNIVDTSEEFKRAVPPGYVPFFATASPNDIGPDAAGFGYGYLAGTADQLAKYAAWQLQTRLSGAYADSPLVPTEHAAKYGLGWYHDQLQTASGPVEQIRHAGAVPGYFTYVSVIPSADRAVVVLANKYGELDSSRDAAAVAHFVEKRIGATTTVIPGSPHPKVIGTLVAVTVGVLALLVHTIWTLPFGRHHTRSPRACTIRVLLIAMVGGLLLYLGIWGVPAVLGAPLEVAEKWAPDAIILLWITIGEIFLTTAALIVREIGRLERFVDLWE